MGERLFHDDYLRWAREKSDRRIPARASEKENASNKPLVFWSFADDNNDDGDDDAVDCVFCIHNGDLDVVKQSPACASEENSITRRTRRIPNKPLVSSVLSLFSSLGSCTEL